MVIVHFWELVISMVVRLVVGVGHNGKDDSNDDEERRHHEHDHVTVGPYKYPRYSKTAVSLELEIFLVT